MNSITLKQWNTHPSFRKDLETLLAAEAMKVAVSIVLDKGISPIPIPAGVDLIHFAALTGARKEGYVEALKNLHTLAQNPAARPVEREPWDTPLEKPSTTAKE